MRHVALVNTDFLRIDGAPVQPRALEASVAPPVPGPMRPQNRNAIGTPR